jgi:Cu+-exporting ATPase
MSHNEDTPDVRIGPEAAARGCKGDPGDRHPNLAASDPVCQMAIEAPHACHALEYAGRMFGFCSEGCLREFLRHPDEYVRRGLE